MRISVSAEKKLVKRCLSNDSKAWADFVDSYHRIIYKSITQTLRKHSYPLADQTADDLFQSVFLSLVDHGCRKLRQFRWNCRLSSWLYIIASRITVDFLRKQRNPAVSLNGNSDTETAIQTKLSNGGPDPASQVEMAEEKRLFENLKEQLKPREQLFLELCYIRELSAEDISRVLDIKVNNVYQMKNRIREKMKAAAKATV